MAFRPSSPHGTGPSQGLPVAPRTNIYILFVRSTGRYHDNWSHDTEEIQAQAMALVHERQTLIAPLLRT